MSGPRRTPPQRDRVLAALRRGPVTQVDFLGPRTIDAGPPITRLAARIDDLRQTGHTIVTAGWQHGCRIYLLEREAPAAATRQPAAAGALFQPAPTSPYEADR